MSRSDSLYSEILGGVSFFVSGHHDTSVKGDIPASSRTSAVKYSMMAATYTAAFAPTLTLFAFLFLKNLGLLVSGTYASCAYRRLTYGYAQQGTKKYQHGCFIYKDIDECNILEDQLLKIW
jgi:hypothetical protein